jgi:hypothetical protein
MRLKNITAIPHLYGNRIDLKWLNPDPDTYPSVLIVRRKSTHPTSPQDGTVVTEGKFNIPPDIQNELDNEVLSEGLRQIFLSHYVFLSIDATVFVEVAESRWYIADEELRHLIRKENDSLTVYISSFFDENLKGETIYYYTLFPYEGEPSEYHFDPHNRISAMASSPYNMAGQMYELLPGIYHRYDTVGPSQAFYDRLSDEDRQRGQLRRFLDIPGSQLDQLYSFAKAMLDLHNLNQVDSTLLHLLAQWIGWQLDYRTEIAQQRCEIRNAPFIYKTVGIIPTIEATVKRIIGWESLTKEFVHNVFISNSPERLNLWALRRSHTGEWLEDPEESFTPKPLSLDFAYEGRPAAVWKDDEVLWLFYHTLKRRYDASKKKRKDTWDIWYKTYREDQGWAPSQPLTKRIAYDRHPTAVFQEGRLWVFWDTYDEVEEEWHINYRVQIGGQWSSIKNFGIIEAVPDWILFHSWSKEYPDHCTVDFTEMPIDTKFRTWHIETQRHMPWGTVDSDGGLWLFWLEKIKGDIKWCLKYNRHNGVHWQLEPARTFPLDMGKKPRVESDLFVIFHPEQKIWVFWSEKESTGGPWQIAYRIKQSIDPTVSDWGKIHILPKKESFHHDCEPAAIINGDGDIELFWSSNQNGSWSVWHGILPEINIEGRDRAKEVTSNPYSQRTPMPLSIDEGALLIYRCNESLHYKSETYKATTTVDFRYAGCTTVEQRNVAKNKLQGKIEDFQTYTYDAGKKGKRTDQNWYSRDTLGIYLTPETEESQQIIQTRDLIRKVLRQFMPIQMRAVFIINPAVYKELVYTYDHPTAESQRFIEESFIDNIEVSAADVYSGLSDSYKDRVPDWIWLRSWSEEYPGHRSVDFTETPVETIYRIWHTALETGG